MSSDSWAGSGGQNFTLNANCQAPPGKEHRLTESTLQMQTEDAHAIQSPADLKISQTSN